MFSDVRRQPVKATGPRHASSQRIRAVISGRRRTVTVFSAITSTQLGTGAWVVAPPYRPKGVVHFLGGAFAGAAPQLAYHLLLDSLAAAGYTVIATPYALTFRHDQCAQAVRQQFLDSLEEIRSGRAGSAGGGGSKGGGWGGSSSRSPTDPRVTRLLPADAAPDDVPVFGLGHSNGSLLHLLIGCLHPGASHSNMLLSFNNKQVKDAVPLPGLLDGLPAAVQAARAAAPALPDLSTLPLTLPLPPLPSSLSASSLGSEVLRGVAALLPEEL
ncbi:hypothetical protein Agub_g3058, partial [Astrephomene gubernaculifera]